MCGILGITNNQNITNNFFKNCLDELNHRGPDGDGVYYNEKLFLGHKRLAIIDVDERSNQPMISDCKNYILVFNGEIYNYKYLKKKYFQQHKFKSKSDTEVLLLLLIKKGLKAIEELDGIFSFAFYSIKDAKLFLSRDTYGIKPLYYYNHNNSFCFSSEIKAIIKLTKRKIIDKKHIGEQILFGYVSGENTLFSDIKRLLPGHVMEFDLIKNTIISVYSYKKIFISAENKSSVFEINSQLVESVKSQTMSDVPIGVMLSGGLDSSILSSISSFFNSGINSYTISLSNKKYDEAFYAKELAKSCNLNYNELKYEYKNFDYLFKHLTFFHDEPIRHINSLPIYSITKMARKMGVKVLLAGEGADEVFGGYGVYLKIKTKIYLSKIFNFLPQIFVNKLLKKGRYTFLNKAKNIKNLEDYLIYSRASTSLTKFKSISSLNLDLQYRKNIAKKSIKSDPNDVTNAMMKVDQNIHLQSLLDRQDKMSMAASVECRVPFLNVKIVQEMNQMDSSKKIYNGITKKLLRDISKVYMPSVLVNRKKHPFGLPLSEQLSSSDLFKKLLSNFEHSLVFKLGLVKSNFENYLHRFDDGDETDSDLIYNVFSLEIWLKVFFDED